LVARADDNGQAVWAKRFVNGRADGLYPLTENADTLMAAGMITSGSVKQRFVGWNIFFLL
jgi:hypothetical protein